MIRALLVGIILASIFGHAHTWPTNFIALVAVAALAYTIGLVVGSERKQYPATSWGDEVKTIELPLAIGKPAATRRGAQ